jgi:hypothetical protein
VSRSFCHKSFCLFALIVGCRLLHTSKGSFCISIYSHTSYSVMQYLSSISRTAIIRTLGTHVALVQSTSGGSGVGGRQQCSRRMYRRMYQLACASYVHLHDHWIDDRQSSRMSLPSVVYQNRLGHQQCSGAHRLWGTHRPTCTSPYKAAHLHTTAPRAISWKEFVLTVQNFGKGTKAMYNDLKLMRQYIGQYGGLVIGTSAPTKTTLGYPRKELQFMYRVGMVLWCLMYHCNHGVCRLGEI